MVLKRAEDQLIDIRKDLKFQLTFEDFDWEYFIDTANRGKVIADSLKEEFVIQPNPI